MEIGREPEDQVDVWRRLPEPRGSVRLVLWGLVWPMLVYFVVGLSGLMVPSYQQEGAMAPSRMLLGGRPLALMIPAMLYAWSALARFLIGDGGSGAASWVRWGLWVGAICSLIYSTLLLVVMPASMGVCALCSVAVVGRGLAKRVLQLSPGEDGSARGLEVSLPYVLLLLGGLAFTTIGGQFFGLVALLPFVLAPMVLSLIFVVALIQVGRETSAGDPKPHVGGLLLAGIGTFASWSAAIRLALEDHAALPLPEPNGCYVATAAAQGHPALVRSAPLSAEPGAMRVNGQLRALKAGEIALRATCPVLHRRIRLVYDRCGPRWATRLSSPWRADVAYLGLVPIALMTRALLALVAPGAGPNISALYRNRCRMTLME